MTTMTKQDRLKELKILFAKEDKLRVRLMKLCSKYVYAYAAQKKKVNEMAGTIADLYHEIH